MAVDEDLHSRQLAVYGRHAMGKLSTAHVLVRMCAPLPAAARRCPPLSVAPRQHKQKKKKPNFALSRSLAPSRRTARQISGLNGLGAEVAKNVILAQVGGVTLHDAAVCELADLGSHFYLVRWGALLLVCCSASCSRASCFAAALLV